MSPPPMPERKRPMRAGWHRNLVIPTEYLALPIPSLLWGVLTRKLGDAPTGWTGDLFTKAEQASVIINAREALRNGAKRTDTGLTVTRLQRHLFNLLTNRGGDVADTVLITGVMPPYGQSSAIYYYNADCGHLENVYLNTIACIPGLHSRTGESNRQCSLREDSVGSLLCPRPHRLPLMVNDLKANLQRYRLMLPTEPSLANFHNSYVLYTLFLLSFATGYRSVKFPISRASDIDWESGFLVIADKIGEDMSHSRLVPLAPAVLEHLGHYQRHREALTRRLWGLQQQKAPEHFLFFLDGRNNTVTRVTPDKISNLAKWFFDMPLNINRHFLRSELRARGIPGELVDVFMGHWSSGQEPHGKFSSFSYRDYRRQVAPVMTNILAEMGWEPLEGIGGGDMNIRQNIPSDSALHGDEYRKRNRFTPEKKAQEKKVTIEIVQREFPEIYSALENKAVSSKQVDTLFKKVCGDKSGHAKRVRHNTLVKFLRDRARDYRWDVDIPAYALLEQGEKALVHPESFAKLPPYRAMVDTFMESLEVSTPSASHLDENLRRYEAGQLIFSMISQGGLHHRHWLQKAVEALILGVVGQGQLIWLDLESGPQLRRWFPDPISALLIRRWFRRWQQQWPDATPEQLLNVFLTSAPASPTTTATPKSLSFILSAAVTASSINHSGFIRNYQSTRNASVSLPEAAWRRLQTKEIPRRPYSEPQQPMDLSQTTPVVDASVLVGDGTENGLATLDRVQKALSSTQSGKTRSRKMMAESLAQIAANERLAPIVRVLSLWCRSLITSRQETGKAKLKISSAKTYLSRIAKPLAVALAAVKNLNELGEDEWEYIYETLIGSAKSSNHRLNRAIQARDFHEFLVDHFAFPEVHIERVSGGERVVDADILTPAEYVRAKQILQLHSADSRMARIRTLVLTLGFRCGLRRGEVQKIQLRDLPGVSEPELENPQLLVRPSAFGSVKTNAAIRRLPLSVLLTAEELRELRYWTQQRLSEQVAPRPMELLFCERHQSHRVLSSLELFEPIQEAMRMASGTKLRFHHLRHTFATLTGLRLLESTPGALMREEWAMDDNGIIVMPHWGEDFSALADLASAGSATGKRLWLLGQWCGHVTPGETLTSYSHLIDWVSFHERLAGENTPLSICQQAYLLGDSVKSVSVFRTRNGLKGLTQASELLSAANSHWPNGFRKTKAGQLQPYRSAMAPGQALEEVVKPNITAMKLYNIFQRIGALQARGKSEADAIEESGAYYSQGVEDVTQWHKRAMQMMNDPSDKKAPTDKAGKRRENVPYDAIHRRWSEDHQSKLPDPFVESSGQPSATRPELIQCPAPPTPHVAQEYCEAIFERLVSWSDLEPEAFSEAMNAIQNAMQRSHPQISFRSDENKKRYRQLLRQANLCHLVRVHVKPPPTRDYKQGKLKNHWSSELGVSGARVKILSESAKSNRREWGVGQINIIPDASLGDAARQMTMSTVRFAIFMAAVVFEGELAIDTKRGVTL